jgi:peptide/nickel transport system substrate-binding protein
VARALVAALVISLLAVSGAGGSNAQTPKRGGTLVLARPGINCLNPFGACGLGTNDPAITQVLEGAFEIGPDLILRPNLVSRVEIGKKPFTLTYHIRPKARWSDGARITTADFRFTYQTFLTPKLADFEEVRALYAKIRRIRTLDARTFRVEFREPFAGWRSTFFDIVLPRHALAGQDVTTVWRDRIDNPKTGKPIGSGPFVVGRFERGRQVILVRNGGYWGPHTAYLDRFIFRFPVFDPADPLGPLRRNEIHFTATPPGLGAPFSAELARDARRIPGWRTVAWPTPAFEHLVFRVGPGGHPALKNKLVRRALAYGIDREEIARKVMADLRPTAQRPLDSTAFLASDPLYRPNWSGYRYRPVEARRLLGRAGCRRGADGIYSCAGERLSLRFFTTAGAAQREDALLLMRAQLRRAGVEVELTFAPFAALFGQILPGGEFDAAVFSWLPDPGGLAMPEAICGDIQNWAGFCSRLIMRDVQQRDAIVDPRQRARVLNAADAKLARAVPVLPLFQGVIRAAIRTNVRGFVAGGTQFHFSQNSENWWLADQP